MTEEQLYDFGEANEEITKMKLEQDKIASESYEEFKAKKKELEEKKARALEEAKKEHEEFVTAKREYENLKKEKQDVKAKLELQKQEHEKNTLVLQREQLNAEIEKLKVKGKNETDPEYREYLSDLEKINKELARKDNEIDETETKLSNIDNRMKELESKYGKEKLEQEERLKPRQEPPRNPAPIPGQVPPQKPTPTPGQVPPQKPAPTPGQVPPQKPAPTPGQVPPRNKVFNFEICSKGIFYNGVLQSEEELLEIYNRDGFLDDLEKMLGKKSEEIIYSGDIFIISSIIKNNEMPDAIEKLEAYADALSNSQNKENNIDIKYDLTGMSLFSRLTHSCNLSKKTIEYAKDFAYCSRKMANVKMGPITSMKFKIKDMIERSNIPKLSEANRQPEVGRKQQNPRMERHQQENGEKIKVMGPNGLMEMTQEEYKSFRSGQQQHARNVVDRAKISKPGELSPEEKARQQQIAAQISSRMAGGESGHEQPDAQSQNTGFGKE